MSISVIFYLPDGNCNYYSNELGGLIQWWHVVNSNCNDGFWLTYLTDSQSDFYFQIGPQFKFNSISYKLNHFLSY